MRTWAAALFLVAYHPPLAAQAPQAMTSAAIDPARLVASERLVAVLMPPGRRDAMLTGMIQAQTANMTKAIESSGELGEVFRNDPRARDVFGRFIARQQAEGTATMRRELPGMMTAMARAHARRFTVQQLDEMAVFFASPTGRAYMDQGMTIMSDPDVAAWQQKVMGETFSKMPAMVRELQAEMLALTPARRK